MIKKILQLLGLAKPNDNAPQRLKTCEGCIFSVKNKYGTWCGTPLIGQTVDFVDGEYTDQSIKLCGCKMEFKTIMDSECPINAWQ